MTATVHLSGPLFDGRGPAAVDAIVEDITRDVTAQAYAEWATNLDGSIRRPTPYYETQLTTEVHGDHGRVHDRGVVYGPWLEGTGSRNRTTRFKGYASARRAAATTQGKARAIAEATVARNLGRLG